MRKNQKCYSFGYASPRELRGVGGIA